MSVSLPVNRLWAWARTRTQDLGRGLVIAVALAPALVACGPSDRPARRSVAPPTLDPSLAASIDPRVLDAVERSSAAVRREPESYERWLALGMDLAANGLGEPAISALEEAARAEGSDGRAMYYTGLMQLEAGRLDRAIPAFDAAAVASPDRAHIWWRLGMARLDAGGADEAAAEAIERAIELDPTAAAAWAGRGRLALADGRPADALAAFEEAMRLTPAAAAGDLRYLSGMSARALQRLGRTEEAEALLAGSAGSIAPQWHDPWRDALVERSVGMAPAVGAAVQLAREGRAAEAIARLEALRTEHPEEPTVLFNLGVAYGLAERYAASAEVLAELLRLEPGRIDAHEQRARALVALAAERPDGARDGPIDEAIVHIETVLENGTEEASIVALRADAHRLAGRIDAAAADYARAGVRAGEPHRWTLIAADMHMQAGGWRSAVDLLERMVADRPEHFEALRLLGAARAESGDLAGAAESLRAALAIEPEDAVAARLLERVEADASATETAP